MSRINTPSLRQALEIAVPVVLLILLFFIFQPQKTIREIPEEETKDEGGFHGELTQLDKERSFDGFTIYPIVGDPKVLLLDHSGEVFHQWNLDADRARLLPNCNLLVVHGSKWGARNEPWKTLKFLVREYGWDGRVVWEYRPSGRPHHDIVRLENGNTLFPIRTVLAPAYHAQITDPRRSRIDRIRSDSILEVTPDKEIVWKWNAEDHLDLNSCGKPACEDENPADWTHMNTTTILPENRWYDQGDIRFRPGNILAVLRNWWTALIIDRETGEIVWRYTGDYRGGISGGHDAYMIEKGLPGAGNILLFDNGRKIHHGESYILEIEPPSKKLEWVYDVGEEFFSNSAGSVQRLPNGNTLISEDLSGRVFEVTPQKKIVWEFQGNLRIARAHRYSPDHCPELVRR